MSNHTTNASTTLTAADLAGLASLGIPIELVAQASIERVNDRDAREKYGVFGHGDMSGLVFLYFDPASRQRVSARLRRDNPEMEGGKPKNKYISAYGDRRHLYMPPGSAELVGDPEVPIVLVEAEKSSLALTAWACRTGRKYLVIAMGGCWGWRGRIGKVENAKGERVDELGPLPELRYAAGGRTVVVLLDSNVSANPKVQSAQSALLRQLKKQKAEVLVAELPSGEGVNGPDDYISLYGDDAMSAVLDAASKPGTKMSVGGPYSVIDGCICHTSLKDHGPIIKPLCNFSARVDEEVVLDDGVETSRTFIVSGTLAAGSSLPAIRVPASRFGGMTWVPEQWGMGAIVNAGLSTRDQLREAVQRLSPRPTHRRVFTHTGWRKVDGIWVYLTSNGAVGREGFEVELGPELKRYAITAEPDHAREAMQASLRLLRIAPLTVTVPLWGAMFLATLASAFELCFTLWVHGPTGSLKSSVAALFLSHFGSFTESSLPGTWSSTANLLERSAFTLKDAPYIIDDFAPSGLDNRELELKAARILRAQGNLSGRGRLRSDLTQRPAWPPRGLVIGTGEQYPTAQSILARTLLLEMARSQVHMEALSQAQKESEALSEAMAGFLTWLAPQMDELPAILRSSHAEARDRATAGNEHLRLPGVIASLWIGVQYAIAYAVEVGALDEVRAEKLREECWDTLLQVGQQQAQVIEGERPSLRFLMVLAAGLCQGRAFLLRPGSSSADYFGTGTIVGWWDQEYIYLIPDAAYQVVARSCREAGEFFPVRSDRLFRDLNREGLTECSQGRHTTTARLGGQIRRILKLKRSEAEKLLGEQLPGGTDPGETDVTTVTGGGE
jgi:hypothetical protein